MRDKANDGVVYAIWAWFKYDTIRYDRWFALENWPASCQFN